MPDATFISALLPSCEIVLEIKQICRLLAVQSNMALPICAVYQNKSICQTKRHIVRNWEERDTKRERTSCNFQGCSCIISFFSGQRVKRRKVKLWIWENSLESRQRGCCEVSIMGTLPLSVLLGWAASGGVGGDGHIWMHSWWGGRAARAPEVRQPWAVRKWT